jgi:dimethylargininase
MLRALARYIPFSFGNALSATPPDPPIDVRLAQRQHLYYIRALAECGVAVTTLPADEACPDCVFIEDTAVVIDRTALVTRPGAPSRRAETAPIAIALDAWVDVIPMIEPATLDGGDVMRVGDRIFVGRSARTNRAGIDQLVAAFAPHGFEVVPLDLPPHVLHLKCVVSPLGGDRILLAEDSIPERAFGAVRIVRVPQRETYAANCVAIGNHAIVAEGFPSTCDALEYAGFTVHQVPTSEVRKADGSLTCQSIIF